MSSQVPADMSCMLESVRKSEERRQRQEKAETEILANIHKTIEMIRENRRLLSGIQNWK